MLYSEFLEGTGAAHSQASFMEYKRVEQIYINYPPPKGDGLARAHG